MIQSPNIQAEINELIVKGFSHKTLILFLMTHNESVCGKPKKTNREPAQT